jgi:hypothetical protein
MKGSKVDKREICRGRLKAVWEVNVERKKGRKEAHTG